MTGARHTTRAVGWRQVDLTTARACIASALLGGAAQDDATGALGDITLLPHQQDAVTRLRETLARFRGALLADDVGLGKTFIALAVARGYDTTHIIAPAALLPMWMLALQRTGSRGACLHSLQGCSRTPPGIPAPGAAMRGLVVIDEAHHLRTPITRRYRAVADALAGHDVLLLSATPLHNRPADLRAQLGLFMGSRSDVLDPELLARLIVRRTQQVLGLVERSSTATPPRARHGRVIVSHRPELHQHAPLLVPHDPATLGGILALPSPLPVQHGAAASALIRLGLLRAWCSSDAAFNAALTRRLLRGSALRDALLAGRHPTNGELRGWVIGDNSEVQLAFPEFLSTVSEQPVALLGVLGLHLDALSALRERHRQTACSDEARVTHIRRTLHEHPGVSMVAFSQFTSTVRALYRALSDIAGVGMLTGSAARIASGRLSRREVLARFAPDAHGLPPPPAHGAIRLLLATDMLAEGVNLQDAGIVMHLDLPWTDALRQQRVGRVARLGSALAEVHVYAIDPPACGERALRQLERLHTKAEHGATLVGAPASVRSAADHASAIRADLQAWLPGSDTRPDCGSEGGVVVLVPGSLRMALALVHAFGTWRLLACTPPMRDVRSADGADDRSVVARDAVVDVRTCVQMVSRIASTPLPVLNPGVLARLVAPAARAVADWGATGRSREQAGARPDSLSAVQRLALDRIRAVLAGESALHRHALVRAADDATRVVLSASGVAGERALDAWLASFSPARPAVWLEAWTGWQALRTFELETPAEPGSPPDAPQRTTQHEIGVLILLEPGAGR